MILSAEQQSLVRKHSQWLNQEHGDEIYNRTIELAGKYSPRGDADRWLLFLANNVYIFEYR